MWVKTLLPKKIMQKVNVSLHFQNNAPLELNDVLTGISWVRSCRTSVQVFHTVENREQEKKATKEKNMSTIVRFCSSAPPGPLQPKEFEVP